MTTPSERLAALGLDLPPVAAPVAAYVPATRSGHQVLTSGQLPTVAGQLVGGLRAAMGYCGARTIAELARVLGVDVGTVRVG